MCRIIAIESIAANAIIETFDRTGKTEIQIKKLNEYRLQVINELRKQFRITLISSYDATDYTFKDYTEFFEIKERDGEDYLVLRTDQTMDAVRDYYRMFLDFEVYKVLTKEANLSKLGL